MPTEKRIYPIAYKVIPTQYAFLIAKQEGKYRVQVCPTRDLKTQIFTTEREARAFIHQKEIL